MRPEAALLYHITHLDNLPNILREGCLHCHKQMHRTGLHPVDIAYPGIQDRRALDNDAGGMIEESPP